MYKQHLHDKLLQFTITYVFDALIQIDFTQPRSANWHLLSVHKQSKVETIYTLNILIGICDLLDVKCLIITHCTASLEFKNILLPPTSI